jgi:long-chain fatty acid transport protein
MNKGLFLFFGFFTMIFLFPTAWADQYHYGGHNIGERASGLAGAYISLADDPSGIYHNPAGILFNYENYFSLSANVYSATAVKFKKAFVGKDYQMNSNKLIPNFFGFTQNYRNSKWGFAIVIPQSEMVDQNDSFNDLTQGEGDVRNFQRRLLNQFEDILVGGAFATEIVKDLSFGISIFGGALVQKTINTQLITYNRDNPNPPPTSTPTQKERYRFVEGFADQTTYYLYPKFGFQFMPAPNWSLGFVGAKKWTLYSIRINRANLTATEPSTAQEDRRGLPSDVTYDLSKDLILTKNTTHPNALSPYELGFGVSYFPNKTLLVSGDLRFYTEDPEYGSFSTQTTYNLSLGTEYYLGDQMALRFGLFTDNANTAPLSSTKKNQHDHLDYIGTAFSATVLSPGSSFTLGFQYSQANGKAQIINESLNQQDVEGKNLTLLFTGSYQL